jgi:hypothetical protein
MAINPDKQNKKTSSQSPQSSGDFRLMLQELAEEAERKLPGPPPKVQKLHQAQKTRSRKIAIVFLVVCLGLGGILFYGIKYPNSMPLGLGGIFQAYVAGGRADTPAAPFPGREN